MEKDIQKVIKDTPTVKADVKKKKPAKTADHLDPYTKMSQELITAHVFEMEVKMRKMITDLMEPMVRVNRATTLKLSDFRGYIEAVRLNQHDILNKYNE